VQQGAPAAVNSQKIGVVGGRLAVQGLTVGLVNGRLTFTNATTNNINQASATHIAEGLQARDVVVNGSLMLSVTGQELLWPGTQMQVQRALAWTYASTLEMFTASVALSGQVTVTTLDMGSEVWVPEPDGKLLNCTLEGQAVLSSKTKPGPGFSGNYSWVGELAMSPDPWTHFNVTSQNKVVTGMRHLLQGAAGSQHKAHTTGREVLQANDSSVQQASLQPVSGTILVKEHGAVAPAMVADDKSGGGLRWLDADGQVVVAGYVPDVRASQKNVSPVVRRYLPLWAWLALAAAILLLFCSVLLCWLVTWRKQHAGLGAQGSLVNVEPVLGGATAGSLSNGSSRRASKRVSDGDKPPGTGEPSLVRQTRARRHSGLRPTDISFGGASGRSTVSSGGRGRAVLSQGGISISPEWWEAQEGTASVPVTPTPPDFDQPPSLWQQRYGGPESPRASRSTQDAPPMLHARRSTGAGSSRYARRSTGTGSTYARRSTGTGSSAGGSAQVRRQAWGPAEP
jgi:hypothetical protein